MGNFPARYPINIRYPKEEDNTKKSYKHYYYCGLPGGNLNGLCRDAGSGPGCFMGIHHKGFGVYGMVFLV